MRTLLLAGAATVALAACSNNPGNTTNTVVSDNMVVPISENAGPTTAPADTNTFLQNAAMSDMYEIAAGTLAVEKAQSPAVKQFARDMIAAHTATTTALKAAVKTDAVEMTAPTALDARHQGLIDALSSTNGAAFDELYKSQQRDAHGEALTLMQSYAADGDKPAIRAFSGDTAPKVRMHIDMLGKLN